MQQFKKRIIVFSSPTNVEDEINTVKQILQTKIEAFHIRKPDYSIEEVRFFLNEIPRNEHSKIVIHNYIELLNEYNLKGYYCTRQFLKTNEIEVVKKKHSKTIFSKGCHSISELQHVEAYDYVFLSPIFNSISKTNVVSNFDIKQLENGLNGVRKPVYALGGVTPNLLSKLKNVNFYGVGILGFLWLNKNPVQQLNEFYR